MNIKEKEKHLKDHLSLYRSAIVAYSGGVDSSLVMAVASQQYGTHCLGVIADSHSLPREELRLARALASAQGWHMMTLKTKEFANDAYLSNDKNRCYHCKTELYGTLEKLRQQWGADVIFDGANVDDAGDYRPGRIAAKETKVISPLYQGGLTKADVRALSKQYGLPNYAKPASPCLSSRFPTGMAIDPEKLARIEKAERYLKVLLSCDDLRVRYFGKNARIDIPLNFHAEIESRREEIGKRFNTLGFDTFMVNPDGLISGVLTKHLQRENATG